MRILIYSARLLSFMERLTKRRFHTESEYTSNFPNGVDVAAIRPMRKQDGYRAELGIDDSAVVALFAGTLAGTQGLMVIPAAARRLAARADIVFVVCADGVMKPRLESASSGLTNIRLIPQPPAERLPELVSMADILLMPQSPDAADLLLPSKLSAMLASGRPVVATCRPGTEIGEIVSQCGLAVPPRDSLALANAVGALADQPALRRDLGRRAREIAEARFDGDATSPWVLGALDRAPSDVADDDAA